jgi:hypothetical protein
MHQSGVASVSTRDDQMCSGMAPMLAMYSSDAVSSHTK